MASAARHVREARSAADEAVGALRPDVTPDDVTRDDLAHALRHTREAAQQIVQAITARTLEDRQ